MPGLLGAERGLGPRQRADARAARGRRVGDRRPEGLDLVGGVVRLVLRAVPHRSRGAEAPRALLPARADEAAGRRDPADPADHRRRGVLRGVLRRRAHRRRRTSSARPATAGGSRWHARVRARRLDARPAACCSRTSSPRSSRSRSGTARRAIRCCASASPTRGSGLEIMRYNALRIALRHARRRRAAARRRCHARSTGPPGTAISASSRWTCSAPRPRSATAFPYQLGALQRLFLFTRAETIYARLEPDPAQPSSPSARSGCRASRGRPDDARLRRPDRAGRAPPARGQDRASSRPPPAPGIGFAAAQRCARGRRARADQRHARAAACARPRRSARRGDGHAAARRAAATSRARTRCSALIAARDRASSATSTC